ncbi:MAG: helix-turn-helix domain-containing protein [Cognatishimia sp.]|uniref:helix-turn-helix domain-containing protein n=1 Tax=Cognatishimia sp. TaxID=2211648 RepID=UPI004059BB84
MTKAEQTLEIRHASGLKQNVFAERLGVSRWTQQRWEAGKYEPSDRDMLAMRAVLAEIKADVAAEGTVEESAA